MQASAKHSIIAFLCPAFKLRAGLLAPPRRQRGSDAPGAPRCPPLRPTVARTPGNRARAWAPRARPTTTRLPAGCAGRSGARRPARPRRRLRLPFRRWIRRPQTGTTGPPEPVARTATNTVGTPGARHHRPPRATTAGRPHRSRGATRAGRASGPGRCQPETPLQTGARRWPWAWCPPTPPHRGPKGAGPGRWVVQTRAWSNGLENPYFRRRSAYTPGHEHRRPAQKLRTRRAG